jgi:hypothetical protein
VAVLASVATEENLAAVLPRFHGLSKKEALDLAAELRPRTVVEPMTGTASRMVVMKDQGKCQRKLADGGVRGATGVRQRAHGPVHPG